MRSSQCEKHGNLLYKGYVEEWYDVAFIKTVGLRHISKEWDRDARSLVVEEKAEYILDIRLSPYTDPKSKGDESTGYTFHGLIHYKRETVLE